MSKEEARRLHVFYKGSPVDKAMRYAERRSLDGDPLPKHKLRSNLTRARKELDSISGVSKFEAWMHAVMYVWACVIARSIFLLYKDIARDGILLPALVLPFYMVYLGACWSRFIWRSSRYFNLDNHTAGMPRVLGEMLNRIDAFFAPQDAHPQAKPVRSTPRLHMGLCVTVVVALVLAIVVFLYSLVGWTILYTPPMPIGGASIMLAVTAAAALALRWHYLKVYLLFNPDSFYVGRLFLPAKKYRYPDIEEFCVFPKNPEQIKPPFYEPSQWQIEIKVPSKIPPNLAQRIPWLRRHIVAVHDERVVCLTSQVAFYLEQERWADLRSPADREKLAEYFTNGNVVCTSLGYKPINNEQP
ncbi:transcriptional regulator [Rothia sp. HMSC072B04]|uniref:transcriptional regulator n=1 Tax=Rothia sp. HMSC072B04 TaxID=1739432 RepID=UPI001FEECCB1|nr:transcriptional regulator [Rothia sp. HMSC072B04]